VIARNFRQQQPSKEGSSGASCGWPLRLLIGNHLDFIFTWPGYIAG
jgi:hypothetical protein